MKITVLNGSPKGDISVTLQSLRFIEKKIPDITLCVHHISQRIKRISKERCRFEAIMNDIENCDAVIWSTPLYVTTVPSQYHRFIEMISEKKRETVFKGKYAAVITTSIHFFDHTAHTFMRAVCEDLGMKYVDGFSPDMYDLLKEDQQNQLLNFAKHFVDVVKTEKNTSKLFAPLVHDPIVYSPGPVKNKIDLKGKKILILADSRENKNLKGMIDRYTASFSSEVDVAYLEEINIKGGCIGCCKCGPDNECSYDGTDDYKCFYNEGMRTADVVIFAGATKGRYLSWQVKQFFDRSFFNTHTPTLKGKQIGFLISGPFQQLANLQQILQAYVEWQKANLIGFVSDEYKASDQLDGQIDSLAQNTAAFLESSYQRPSTFLGVGGMKIFRDDIWGRLRFVFQADHNHYTENGYYDFPQNEKATLEFNEQMIEAMADPNIRQSMRDTFKTNMVKPHQQVVDQA